ncbi:MAG: hypothetical protein K8R13_03800 [Methanococcoides sp.]|nr:hypothetical protein [Methanococcoides sp.]
MNPLELIIESLGVQIGFFGWLMLTIAAYFVFGFGGCVFDFTCWRFRNQSNGQFIKWEFPLIFGTFGDLLLIGYTLDTMNWIEAIGAFGGLVVCIGLTVLFGMSTRSR